MTFKLALMNIKKRAMDYIVLLMGLVIAVATFYVFQTLSLNKGFLEEMIPSLAMIGMIFQLGAVLLGMITIVYLFYANSFLLAMRQKEYGMYLMLGAKKNKIRQMMTIELFSLGSLSVLLGIIGGMLFGQVATGSLMSKMGLTSNSYQAFSPLAILVTVIFFAILFLLAAIFNGMKFTRTPLLVLLKENEVGERSQKKPHFTFFLTLFSLVLLGIGYYSLWHLETIGFKGLVIALFTITFGTFFFFKALLPFVVNRLKNQKSFSNKNLRMFTLSQLSFKASALSRVLGMVAMLFALSLGAISVGNGFNSYKEALLKQFPYDVLIHNPKPESLKEVDKLTIKQQQIYQMKQVDNQKYFIESELQESPIMIQEGFGFEGKLKPYDKLKAGDHFSFEEDSQLNFQIMMAFQRLENPYVSYQENPHYFIVDQATFDQIDAEKQEIYTYQLTNFTESIDTLEKIDQIENGQVAEPGTIGSKLSSYLMIDQFVSGFVFMGMLLGIAFLAMLASCLMFKVLSGAYQDVARYKMLHKIGVQKKDLTRSIAQEIFVIFLVPGILGTIHVLFGLKMFELLIPEPYAYIMIPFAVFAILYLVYYFVTVVLYRKIVLPK